MEFSLTDDQRMLADLAARLVEKRFTFEEFKRAQACAEGYLPERWSLLAETGLLGLNIAEEQGGMGGTPVDTAIVMEAFGQGLLLEPFVQTSVIAARLIAAAGGPQAALLLPQIAAGKVTVAIACHEPAGRFDLWHVRTRATRSEPGWALQGAKCTVPFGGSADYLIVPARTAGLFDAREGITLFLVERRAAGVTVADFRAIDGHRTAEVKLESVRVLDSALLGQEGEGYALLEQSIDYGIAARCAEAVGVMQKLVDLTVAYLRTRKQFGKPIGSFQALQHRAADMVIAVEQARSAALMATAHAGDADSHRRRRGISAAKAMIGRRVGESAVQLHGGMGMTDEMECGHYFKRLVAIDKSWGDSDHHAEIFAELME